MAVFTSSKGVASVPVSGHGIGGNTKSAFVSYSIAANPTGGSDSLRLFQLPAGCTVVGGNLWCSDIDTGTEQFDADLGWEANGVEAVDTDGFGNFGTWATTAVTNVKPETGTFRPLGGVMFSTGFPHFTNATWVTITYITASATFAAGVISVRIDYVMD